MYYEEASLITWHVRTTEMRWYGTICSINLNAKKMVASEFGLFFVY